MAKQNENPLAVYVSGLSRDLSKLLPRALTKAEPDAIHRVRVTTRRLGSVLRLLSPRNRRKKRSPAEEKLRRLRRRLGKVRDLDVMLARLQAFEKQHPAAARWLISIIREKRAKSAERLGGRESLAGVASHDGELASAAARAQAQAIPGFARTIREQLDEFCERANSLSLQPGARRAGEGEIDLHSLRISGKRLRYSLEIAAAAGASLLTQTQSRLKRIQDVLGDWHDYVVLAQFAIKIAAKGNLAIEKPEIFRQVLALVQELADCAKRQIYEFIGAWKQSRAEITQAVGQIVASNSKRGRNDSVSRAARKSAKRRQGSSAAADTARDSGNQGPRGVTKASAIARFGDLAQ
jgi:CHAD domain-containing protein